MLHSSLFLTLFLKSPGNNLIIPTLQIQFDFKMGKIKSHHQVKSSFEYNFTQKCKCIIEMHYRSAMGCKESQMEM